MSEEKNQEYLLDEPEDIYGALRKIVLMGTPVKVRIDGSDEEFTSAIPQTDFKSRSFFMDKVIPQHGNDLIRAGKRFHIECDSQGVRIEFRMTGRLKYQPQKEQYRAEFPEQVLYLQRRTAYRVAVPPAHNILLKIKMNDGEGDLLGRLLDLSSSGFKAHFSANVKKRLEEQRDFPIARVRFNKENTMDCSLEARHIINDDEGNTICGFAFTMISAMAQRYLDRLITEFQWEERHHKDLEEESLGDV
ncbi:MULTISPECIES: flagellar brake protein [Oceanospirillaceae]|jgi:c-di-GMP-binding flagellar brake protein YcgR|uniref:flagellar brake protein n=1 Tax=Oceanospirillaceae TaxID=135620 RepID=UPI000C43ED63|nr:MULTISPECIES: flagellar brake protein [Thalassolituus]MAY14944.1 hypothetical protein [Oceanospirillaceae bacterium]MBU2039262.1 flagellar brake protein [Gammaproteobacteria bacterium]PIQ39365.1 MAG: hypothetical protein COW58_12070 [Thalassolituus sp. CG17_big_fil_post_rev_8_21_14_2_50_53_8]MCA6061871.1 flagellar brake protein [Thalassolituus sp. ST750PaO-4]MCB2385237.1 flagellar brake protein [Thalassolituus alkanivorans]